MVSFIISIVSLTPAPFVDYLMERKTTHNDVKISKPKRQWVNITMIIQDESCMSHISDINVEM